MNGGVIVKQRFLVLYDYGQGGVWAFIHARSEAEIKSRYAELDIYHETPEWLSSEVVSRIEERMTFDIDKPEGWLAELGASRKPHTRDVAAG